MVDKQTMMQFVMPGGEYVITVTLNYDAIQIEGTSPFGDLSDWSRRYSYPAFAQLVRDKVAVAEYLGACEMCGHEVSREHAVMCDGCVNQSEWDRKYGLAF